MTYYRNIHIQVYSYSYSRNMAKVENFGRKKIPTSVFGYHKTKKTKLEGGAQRRVNNFFFVASLSEAAKKNLHKLTGHILLPFKNKKLYFT